MSENDLYLYLFQLNSFIRSILQHSEDQKHEVANRYDNLYSVTRYKKINVQTEKCQLLLVNSS